MKSETSSDTVNVEPNNADEPEPTVFIDSEEIKDNTPLDNRAQKLIDSLTDKNIIVPYPSDFSKWSDEFYARLEKLNK